MDALCIHFFFFYTMQSFEFCQLSPADFQEVISLEDAVIASLSRPDLLRRNTQAMWSTCLSAPHFAIGTRVEGELVALAVLYVPQSGDDEDLSQFLLGIDSQGLSANYKICLVHPSHRGHALQQTLGRMLEEHAVQQHIALLCSTASPFNAASIHSLERLGYSFNRELTKYGFRRNLYYKFIR